ncbi:EpsI family protein [Armatimonadetes bacterium GBS]|jgi:EpsI family protein|nr:hypothetical protein HRbin14_00729 [bacterium HR14]GIV11928.1 MAG: hypothetical protein KatS3mg021_0210 [Fimbriimonadales bacterium]CUU10388.1 EpsI family protein [Armatimonadetes bacterium GBS]CUU34610.1 EpsI family protein [Armatimonadetes bacterium GXS]
MEEMKTPVEVAVESADGQDTAAPVAAEPQRDAPPAPPMDWKRFGVPSVLSLLLMVGLLVAMQVMPRAKQQTGEKMLNRVPTSFGEWNLLEEYTPSQRALDELMPDEYLARIYVGPGGEQADFTIIAGSHTGAFHNPQVCFRVQNWEFADNREIELKVPGMERPIPARAVQLVSLEGAQRQAVGIYFYTTPYGYRSDTSSARILLLLGRLSGLPSKAYFVRFLKVSTGNAERDMETLKQFAEAALSAMRQTNPEVVP